MKNQSTIILILAIILLGIGGWIYYEYLAIPKLSPNFQKLETTFDTQAIEEIKTYPTHGNYPINPRLNAGGRSDPFAPF